MALPRPALLALLYLAACTGVPDEGRPVEGSSEPSTQTPTEGEDATPRPAAWPGDPEATPTQRTPLPPACTSPPPTPSPPERTIPLLLRGTYYPLACARASTRAFGFAFDAANGCTPSPFTASLLFPSAGVALRGTACLLRRARACPVAASESMYLADLWYQWTVVCGAKPAAASEAFVFTYYACGGPPGVLPEYLDWTTSPDGSWSPPPH